MHFATVIDGQCCFVCLRCLFALFVFVKGIQLFRERLSEKNVHPTIPKGNMGYDQNIVPDAVAVEPTFVVFL